MGWGVEVGVEGVVELFFEPFGVGRWSGFVVVGWVVFSGGAEPGGGAGVGGEGFPAAEPDLVAEGVVVVAVVAVFVFVVCEVFEQVVAGAGGALVG